MKKLVLFALVFSLNSCVELQQIAEEVMQNQPLSNADIATGLRQALEQGIDDRVSSLAVENGFLSNELVRIMLPQELQKVDRALRNIGLGNLADEGIKLLNRAAEDAVAEATPVFINAIKNLSITDARNILFGDQTAATDYLRNQTTQELYARFQPIINNSFAKVGAADVWSNVIQRYNQLPLTQDVNPDLTDYVTTEALKGVFKMVEIEEIEIREKVGMRKTQLMQRVFALQDAN